MEKENLKYHSYIQAKFLTSVQRETSQQHTVPGLEYKKIHHSTQLSSFTLSNGEKIQRKKNITWKTADDPISKSLLYNPAPRLKTGTVDIYIYIYIYIYIIYIYCGFESRRGHGYLSLVSVVCCQVEVSATSWSLVQRSPTDCGASLCVI